MSVYVWLTFIVAAIPISLSPGAGAISRMTSGMCYGYRRSPRPACSPCSGAPDKLSCSSGG